MAELKASELKYGVPLVTKLGGLLFTATNIETPETAEYAPEGALYLNLAKLGLTDEAVYGNAEAAGPVATAGETASTTSPPIFAWSTPLIEAKAQFEAGKLVSVMFPTSVSITTGGKICLRIYGMGSAAAIGKPMLEPKTSTKAAVSLCACTVFCLGK